MTIAAQIARARFLFERGDFLPILVLVVAVQGTVLVSQSIAVLLLDTATIGKIRLFESMISIGVLVAGFGAPALAIREMAAHENADKRGEMLRNLLILPVLGAVIICLTALMATLLGAKWIAPLRDVLFASSLLLVAINLVRMASAVAQGLVVVRHVYIWVIAGAFLAAILQIAGAASGSISGWIGGRLLGELALLLAMLFAMRPYFPNIKWRQRLHLSLLFSTMLRATIVNAGLIVRMLADGAPILLLGGMLAGVGPAATSEDVGHFGIATLILTACLLPLSVMSQRALPLIATATKQQQTATVKIFRRQIFLAGLFIGVIMGCLLTLLHLVDNGQRDMALMAGMALMLTIPMKAVASGIGTIMLANAELKLPVWITTIELICILAVFACLGSINAVWASVIAVIAGSSVSLISFMLFFNLRRAKGTI
jgi:O-antigen/teichoic acid export membrane protein